MIENIDLEEKNLIKKLRKKVRHKQVKNFKIKKARYNGNYKKYKREITERNNF